MGRRYVQKVSRYKDLITYTVNVDGVDRAVFKGNKTAAKQYAESQEGTVLITKTREQIER